MSDRKILTLPIRRRSLVDAEIKALGIKYDQRVANQPPPPEPPEGWTPQDLIRYEIAMLEAHIADGTGTKSTEDEHK